MAIVAEAPGNVICLMAEASIFKGFEDMGEPIVTPSLFMPVIVPVRESPLSKSIVSAVVLWLDENAVSSTTAAAFLEAEVRRFNLGEVGLEVVIPVIE